MADDDELPTIWVIGLGPTLAFGRAGVTIGWEARAAIGYPLFNFAVGGDYGRQGSRPGMTHYIAWEPGMFVGASIGLSIFEPAGPLPTTPRSHIYAGGWAGAAGPLNGPVVPSFAIGYRYIGGEHQFYATPKLNLAGE